MKVNISASTCPKATDADTSPGRFIVQHEYDVSTAHGQHGHDPQMMILIIYSTVMAGGIEEPSCVLMLAMARRWIPLSLSGNRMHHQMED